jgi:apolipoprotein N-acyltransferase
VRSMDLGGLRVGPLLCFEGLFPDLSYRQALNRAQFIAIMSDDDWFMNSSAPQQLREASIWRAVETGLPVVRVGSLGYSLACNAKGVLIATVPLGRSEALTTAIPLARPNPWIILLPAFPVCCIVVTLVLIMPKKARDERRKNRFDR